MLARAKALSPSCTRRTLPHVIYYRRAPNYCFQHIFGRAFNNTIRSRIRPYGSSVCRIVVFGACIGNELSLFIMWLVLVSYQLLMTRRLCRRKAASRWQIDKERSYTPFVRCGRCERMSRFNDRYDKRCGALAVSAWRNRLFRAHISY
jgi:hypothetical protein